MPKPRQFTGQYWYELDTIKLVILISTTDTVIQCKYNADSDILKTMLIFNKKKLLTTCVER